MTRKLTSTAFEAYVALGEGRTYLALARQFNVTKRCVTKRAAQEGWADRLAKVEENAKAISDRRMSEDLADMHERHLKMVKFMGARVLAGLRDLPIKEGMDAIRAGDIVIKLERLLQGESSKHTEVSVREMFQRDVLTLLEVVPDEAPRVIEAEPAADDDELAEAE